MEFFIDSADTEAIRELCSFLPIGPSFARVFGQKCARRGLACGDSGAFQPEMRPNRMFEGDAGVF
jgi:hypothetical protein